MKKSVKFVSVLAALAVLTFSASACSLLPGFGKSEETSKAASVVESSAESSQEGSADESSVEESSDVNSEPESSVESSVQESLASGKQLSDYLKESDLANFEDSFSNDDVVMKVKIEDGNCLVYEATYREQVKETDAVVSYLETYISQSGFSSLAGSMEKSTGVDGVTIVVRYLNADGTLLLEKEFTSNDVTESSAESTPDESSVAAAPTGSYSSLDEYLNDPTIKSTMDSTKESFSNDTFDVDIFAEDGTKFVYLFKYKIDLGGSSTGDYLTKSLEGANTTYDPIAKQLQELIGDKSISVVVRYVDKDGNLLAEKEYVG